MSGKGSTPRPLSVDATTFASNYAATFKPQYDLDPAERLRRANLERAQHVILGTPCGDWPASDPMPSTDATDD